MCGLQVPRRTSVAGLAHHWQRQVTCEHGMLPYLAKQGIGLIAGIFQQGYCILRTVHTRNGNQRCARSELQTPMLQAACSALELVVVFVAFENPVATREIPEIIGIAHNQRHSGTEPYSRHHLLLPVCWCLRPGQSPDFTKFMIMACEHACA